MKSLWEEESLRKWTACRSSWEVLLWNLAARFSSGNEAWGWSRLGRHMNRRSGWANKTEEDRQIGILIAYVNNKKWLSQSGIPAYCSLIHTSSSQGQWSYPQCTVRLLPLYSIQVKYVLQPFFGLVCDKFWGLVLMKDLTQPCSYYPSLPH